MWNTQTGKEVAKFEWKKQPREGPKSIKFTTDESYCGRLATKHNIEIYDNGSFDAPRATIVASAENLAKKGDLAKYQGKKTKSFWFDGFEFVPLNPDASAQTQTRYLIAW